MALADKVGAPVWAAPSSERVPFPEDHPLYAGGLPFAQGLLSERLAGHDLVVVIGAPVFRYYPWVPGDYIPQGARLLHITDDPAESGRAPVGDSLVSDGVLAVRGLTGLVPERQSAATVTMQEQRLAPHPSAETSPADPAGDDKLTARQLFRVLREAMPGDTVVVQESASNIADLHSEWAFTAPDSYFAMASGALGWDLPAAAAVGVALAERDLGRNRPVLALIGDGAMQYSPQAIYTAVHQELPLVIVVPANGEYAILKAFAKFQENPGVPALDIPGLQPHLVAQGYGATGLVASTAAEVKSAIADALTRPGPTVIEVPIDPVVPPLV